MGLFRHLGLLLGISVALVPRAQAVFPTRVGCVNTHIYRVLEAHARAVSHSSVFDEPAFANLSDNVRQKSVLLALTRFHGDALDAAVADAARAKLNFFQNTEPDPRLEARLAEIGPAQAGRDALEYSVENFNNRGYGDGALRSAVIDILGRHSESDVTTIEALLPVARGVNTAGFLDFQKSGHAIVNILARRRDIPEFYMTERNLLRPAHPGSIREALKGAQVVSVKPISAGNNVNSTLIVTLRLLDGRTVRGVFKAMTGESTINSGSEDRVLFTREIQAYDFFAEYFSHPRIHVPETLEVVVRHGDQSYGLGSFQLFADGMKTVNEFYAPNGRKAQGWMEYGPIWDEQRKDPRWAGLGAWIKAFDWAMGNTDRFQNSRYGAGNPNNILMKENGYGSPIEIALIDTGNGRRIRPPGEFDQKDLPPAQDITPDLKQKLLSFDEPALQKIRDRYGDSISAFGLDDLINRLRTLRNHAQQAP